MQLKRKVNQIWWELNQTQISKVSNIRIIQVFLVILNGLQDFTFTIVDITFVYRLELVKTVKLYN